VTGPDEINNCDVVTFTIVATNDAITTTNVIITSTMPAGFAPRERVFNVGTVGPNETITRHAVFTATCDAVSGQNETTVHQDAYSDFTIYTNFVVNPGAITLRKEPAIVEATLGDVVTWTIYIENTGYGTVSNVVVTDTLGSGLQYVSGITSASYVSIPVGETYSFTLAARVVSCSGLDNNVEATWGCPGQTCQFHTAQASVDLLIATPLLDFTPPSINLNYCDGQGTYTMPITNTGDGPAYTPTIAVDFSPLVVTASSAPYSGGAFHLPDIPANGTYVLTFSLSLPDPPCDVAGQSGSLLYEPTYYDQCGNLFYTPVRTGSWTVGGDVPSLDVSKSGPGEVYADEPITYTLTVSSANISGTVFITDVFYAPCGYTLLDAGGGTVVTDADHVTITWSTTETTWTRTLVFSPTNECPDVCGCCGEFIHNTLYASGADCQDCSVTDSDSADTPMQCEEILRSRDKVVSPPNAEACTTRTFTNTYVFASSFAVTPTWQGMVFTDTMPHLSYITGSAQVIISDGTQSCTATFTVSDTAPLVIGNISPTCPITVPGATMRIVYQAIVADDFTCSGGRFYDWSYLDIGVTGNFWCAVCDDGVFEEGVWVGVEEPEMEVSISGVPDTVSACGVYTPLITLTRLGDVPAYDVRLRFPITDYAVIEVLGFGGATPVVTHTGATSWTWEYADAFTTATTATVHLRVQRRCNATGPVQAAVYYDNLCADDDTYDDTCSAAGSRSPLVLTPSLIIYKFPEIIYASDDIITWTLTAINSGAGPAYNVTLTDTLGSDLRYLRSTITSTMGSAAGVTPITSTNRVTWTGLTVLPGEEYTIKYVAEVIGCDDLTNEFASVQGCQGQICQSGGPVTSVVELPETVLINTNSALTPIATCATRTVTATVRNAGLLSVYSAIITETLPAGMRYMTGTTRYVVSTGPSPPATGWTSGGEPSGAPFGPLEVTIGVDVEADPDRLVGVETGQVGDLR